MLTQKGNQRLFKGKALFRAREEPVEEELEEEPVREEPSREERAREMPKTDNEDYSEESGQDEREVFPKDLQLHI